MQHQENSDQRSKFVFFFSTSTPRWTWKRSKYFTLKKKNSLFKSQNISKMITKNNATLYNLKSTLSKKGRTKKKKKKKKPWQHCIFPAIFNSTDTHTATFQEIEYLQD